MAQDARSIKSNNSSCNASTQKSWMNSFQRLNCVVPSTEKLLHDVPNYEEDNFHLSVQSIRTASPSPSSQPERRQSVSPYYGPESYESRHPFEIYKNEFMPPRVWKDRELSTESSSSDSMKVVTPDQHMDFIRHVLGAEVVPTMSKDQPRIKLQQQQQHVHLPKTETTSSNLTLSKQNSIMIPLLDESSSSLSTRQEISLSMRRDGNYFYGFEGTNFETNRENHTRDEGRRNAQTRQMLSSPTIGPRATTIDIKCDDEWRLLQEAKLEIASVKNFLRRNSILYDENEELSVGVETLLLNDDHVAVMELSSSYTHIPKSDDKRFLRRISFGEKPPLPPKLQQDAIVRDGRSTALYTGKKVKASSRHLAEF